MIDRKRLRELALDASPGWYYAGCWTVHNAAHQEVAHSTHEADAHFIAVANPQTILALLDALDAADKLLAAPSAPKEGTA